MTIGHEVLTPRTALHLHADHQVLHSCRLRCHLAQRVRYRGDLDSTDDLADFAGQSNQKLEFDSKSDLGLIVLVDMSRGVVELPPAHLGIAIYKDPLPRHLHIIKVHQSIVLVVARSERVIEFRYSVLFIRFTR